MAVIAVGACVYCETEPGDASAKALIATLRKRLSLAHDSVPLCVRMVQVRRTPRQYDTR